MDPMNVRVALTGSGKIAHTHAAALRGLAGVELAAVVNHRPESMAGFAAQYHIPRQYARVEDLLADGAVDALIVTTPNHLHAPQTLAALDAGLAVLVEKPMALSAVQAEAMVAASQRTGCLLMVAHCWRFDPEVRWLHDQIKRGALGQVVRTKSRAVHVNWGPPGWYAQRQSAGGGALLDMGVHAIDTARFLLGDPQPLSVTASVGSYYQDADVDDTAMLLVRWDNGVSSFVEAGWWQPYAEGPDVSVQVFGTAAFGQVLPTRLVLRQDARGNGPAVDAGFAAREQQSPPAMYAEQVRYFVQCIRDKSRPVPGGLEGWTNMRVVDAAYESARSGRTVELQGREGHQA
jgi:predicted dehydrogenase